MLGFILRGDTLAMGVTSISQEFIGGDHPLYSSLLVVFSFLILLYFFPFYLIR